LKDSQVDSHLVEALYRFEIIDRDWVAISLVSLSERIDEKAFSDLLLWLEPSENAHNHQYHIHQYNLSAFKTILMNTIRFTRLDNSNISHHLGRCIKAIFPNDPDFLFIYYNKRLEYYRKFAKEKDYSYEIFPAHSLDLTFVREHKDYRIFLNKILELITEDHESSYYHLQFLECILGIKHFHWDEDKYISIDNTTLEVYSEWIKYSEVKYKTVFTVICDSFNSSLLCLFPLLIKYAPNDVTMDDLMNLIIPRYWSGKRSVIIQKRMEDTQKALLSDKDTKVQGFLAYAEKKLGDIIVIERRRETMDQ